MSLQILNTVRWGRALFAAAFIVSASGAVMAQTPAPASDPVVAKVNGVDIRESDVALAEEEVGASLPQDATPDARLGAVWAKAHDLAAERHGGDNVMRFFTAEAGKALMDELEALSDKATVADMLAVVDAHIPDPKASRPGPGSKSEPGPA